MKPLWHCLGFLGLALTALCARADDGSAGTALLGSRLFLETRFSRFFFANSAGNANDQLPAGDPVMDTTATIYGPLPGPFAGQSMNCRACHLVAEQETFGNRTYADFAPRSPVPANGDGRTQTPRNSISLVNALLPRPTPLFLHFDGQFANAQDLVLGTLTGRNFGWKAAEYTTAASHIVHIIRGDDGQGALARRYGGWSYAQALAGSSRIPAAFRIQPAYRLVDVTVTNTTDPRYVSDERILQDVAALVQAYLETLVFSRDTNGLPTGSPYDAFLIKNDLPRGPAPNESPAQYSRRLLGLVANLANPFFVTDPVDGHFQTHQQTFQFGPTELAGLKLFFAQPSAAAIQGSTGNCIICHPAPAFTDYLFHNTGATQDEYDSVHGAGAFLTLYVPSLGERQTNYNAFLPPTPNHPYANGVFSTPPALNQPEQIDLGLWNVFANPDFPAPQAGLQQILPQLLAVPAPVPGRMEFHGNTLVLSITNGTPGWPCYLLSTTSLELPVSQWAVLSSNAFDAQGNLSFTNLVAPGPTGFLRLAAGVPPPALALPRTLALFKTPNLRDLGSSDPYFHTGRMNTLENVISFYQRFSNLARSGQVRNAAPELSGISLDNAAVVPLAAFLRALNQDYFDPIVPPASTPGTPYPNQPQSVGAE